MVVADTEYGHRAMGEVLPLRDAFVSVFFVSLGMLFDLRVVLSQPMLVVLLLLGFGVSQYDCRQFRSSLVKYTRCNDGLREGGQQAVRNAYWQSEQQMRAARDVGRAYTNSR
jgi:hypothetical protein